MLSPVLPSPLALALGAACAAATLAAAPGAGAATLKLPAPAAGEVAVAAAPVTGAAPKLKVGRAGVPKGVAVTGGVVRAGARRVALVAVIRPRTSAAGTPSVAAGAGRTRLGGAARAAAVLGAAPPPALTTAVAPACAGAAAALGHPLRRGAGAPAASDLATLGRVLAARLCGKEVDAKGAALLGLLGLRAPAAAKQGPPPGTGVVLAPAGVVAGAGGAPSTVPSGGRPAPAPGGGPAAPPSGAPQCSNGKDDDNDGQVDALGRGAALFDPGCSGPGDTSESSEKATPRACGLGVYTRATRRGFGVDFDSLSYDTCPKPMVKGVVDLASAITDCISSGWEGGAGNASCTKTDGALVLEAGSGGQWQATGDTAADLCGTRGVIAGYTADGQAWEQELPVFDGAEVCKTPPPADAATCANGLDDDGDGQVDVAGLPGAGPDPGCSSAADGSEDSEVDYPATGCWPIVAADPGDPTIAYIYVIPTRSDFSCPTMDAAWITFDDLQVLSCESGPLWGGAAAGTCAVEGGDAVLSGGAGERIAVALKLSGPVGCDQYTPGHVDMRTPDGVVHDGVFDEAYINADDELVLCG
jgi:hypothetical protein